MRAIDVVGRFEIILEQRGDAVELAMAMYSGFTFP
jgi:hypothetical protein